MTDAEIEEMGRDFALAIRARGQLLADQAGDERTAAFVRSVYEDTAAVTELRTQIRRMGVHLKAAEARGAQHGR
ncbi:MAG TPA: hypothetical protein VNX29_01915 [Kaistia sp.]|nr:hypothetical protein [Kaistia sp.]